jgi:AAHS family 4-hydroxybenzoate transporter-like MFS transporter
MTAGRDIDLSEVIDAAPISRFQILSIVLCGLVAILDGFDTQAIAFVAPLIARTWSLDVSALGPIFGAGLLGLTIGALAFGPVADRLGRRRVILVSTAVFGLFSLLTVAAHDFTTLFTCRLLTGIGLGGAMPNIIALTAEYSPTRHRATLVTVMFCGFPLGAVLGGLISVRLLSAYDWTAVFYLGGILPLLLLPVLYAWLPESVRFKATRGDAGLSIIAILRRIDPTATYEPTDRFRSAERPLAGLSIRHLFSEGRGAGTVLLWIVFFSNLLIMYFLINWLPSVLQKAGLPIERAIIGTVLLNAGGIVGGILLGRVIDRLGPFRVLTVAYACAAAVIAAIGYIDDSAAVTMAIITVAGFLVIGTQFCMNALAASFYPTSVRSTGVGWALGIGRIGSIIGPVLGGIVLSFGWSPAEIFAACAVPALVAASAVFMIGKLHVDSPRVLQEAT